MSKSRLALMAAMMGSSGGGGGGGDLSDYVSDGLIFHLDGIERGGTTGHWVDRIGSVDFTLDSGVVEQTDCIEVSATNSYCARNSSYGNAETTADEYTIECVFKVDNNWSALFQPFLPVSGICMVYTNSRSRTSRGVRGSSSSTKQWSTYVFSKVANNTISINGSRAIQNGSTVSTGWVMYNDLKTSCVCGNLNGKMYAVRIYSRILSATEMLQNQQVDNIRFNLGLTITT